MKPFLRIFSCLFLAGWCWSLAVPAGFAGAPAAPDIPAASGILVDSQTGKILWAKDDRAVRAPASLTKIMTAMVVLENAKLDDTLQITPEARRAHGSRTYAEQGWTFSVEDMLWGLLLSSGNDAAIALAQKVSPDGSVDGFAQMMNARAAEMGATNSHFTNPHGLDEPGHYSTSRDLALMTMVAMDNPVFARMVGTSSHLVNWGDGNRRRFKNHNKLLAKYPGAIGVKTGYTNQAGHSLASAASRDGKTLIVVTLGSVNHYAEATALYDWGFANLSALRDQSTEELHAAPAPILAPPPAQDVGFLEKALQSIGSVTDGLSLTTPSLTSPLYLGLAAGMVGSVALLIFMGLRWRRLLIAVPPLALAPDQRSADELDQFILTLPKSSAATVAAGDGG